MIPRPLLDKGNVRESHLTLARVLEAFPPIWSFVPLLWFGCTSSDWGSNKPPGTTLRKTILGWPLEFCQRRRGYVCPKRSSSLLRQAWVFQNWPRWVVRSLFGCLNIKPLVPRRSISTWLFLPTPIPFFPCWPIWLWIYPNWLLPQKQGRIVQGPPEFCSGCRGSP